MALIYLIRHCTNDSVGKFIGGRKPGILLNSEGEWQAHVLARALASHHFDLLCSSPLERTQRTAEIIADYQALKVLPDERLIEIDYGHWTGRTVLELAEDPLWRRYNTFRQGTRIPGGEIIAEVQARMVASIEEHRGSYPSGRLGFVSHGDPIKTVLAYYLGFPLEAVLRLDISVGSVSMLRVEDWGSHVICINRVAEGLPPYEA